MKIIEVSPVHLQVGDLLLNIARAGRYSRMRMHGPEVLEKYIAQQKARIPSYDALTRRESEYVLQTLAEHFDVKVPELRWRAKVRRGSARGIKNMISCGPDAWRGLTNCLLHEFAHILHYQRGDEGKAHGKEFMGFLWDTVLAWHGDASLYAWKEEYPLVAKWGLSRISSASASIEQQTLLVQQ